jgi:hypothetical protein
MTPLKWGLFAVLVLAIIIILRALFTKTDVSKIPCSVRQTFCSSERRKFWYSLQQAVGDDYVVLANVPLAALLVADGEGGAPLQDWLRRHWVDFAIVHEELFMPSAVVQFERQEEEDGIWPSGRDLTLETVLGGAGLTLLWLPSDRYQHVELLRHALEQAKAKTLVSINKTS